MTKPTKTRREVIVECAQAVQACWQHYCDQRIGPTGLDLIRQSLEGVLPSDITTDAWSSYAEFYARQIKRDTAKEIGF